MAKGFWVIADSTTREKRDQGNAEYTEHTPGYLEKTWRDSKNTIRNIDIWRNAKDIRKFRGYIWNFNIPSEVNIIKS